MGKRDEKEEEGEEKVRVEVVTSRKGQRRFLSGDKDMVAEAEKPTESRYPIDQSREASRKRVRGIWLRRLVSDVQIVGDRRVNIEDSYVDSLTYSYIKSYLF
jgi:hypothetical protein